MKPKPTSVLSRLTYDVKAARRFGREDPSHLLSTRIADVAALLALARAAVRLKNSENPKWACVTPVTAERAKLWRAVERVTRTKPAPAGEPLRTELQQALHDVALHEAEIERLKHLTEEQREVVREARESIAEAKVRVEMCADERDRLKQVNDEAAHLLNSARCSLEEAGAFGHNMELDVMQWTRWHDGFKERAYDMLKAGGERGALEEQKAPDQSGTPTEAEGVHGSVSGAAVQLGSPPPSGKPSSDPVPLPPPIVGLLARWREALVQSYDHGGDALSSLDDFETRARALLESNKPTLEALMCYQQLLRELLGDAR